MARTAHTARGAAAVVPAGIRFVGPDGADAVAALRGVLRALDVADRVEFGGPGRSRRFGVRIRPEVAAEWAPGFDTLSLAARLGLDPDRERRDRVVETVVGLLLAPRTLEFPSFAEFESAVRMRIDTVEAGQRTALAFDTEAIERPEDSWSYAEPTGFTVRPGRSLVDALVSATQPEASGRRYAFSCYRASEYVMLIGIAREAARSNPAFLARLQARKERRAVQSGEFHDSFLREYGSMDAPLPLRYHVPGDRVWFRNPDERSADAEGYEGSWVIYTGDGRFTNFWIPERPFTLTTKCVEIHHWRHAAWRDAQGRMRIDEAEVERRVQATLADPEQTAAVIAQMERPREPRGVYRDGGCMDTTREFPRFIRPDSCDMVLAER